jgi:hypothetical protein
MGLILVHLFGFSVAVVSDCIQDLYSPGGLPALDEVGLFTGQSDISTITDLFQPDTLPTHPVYRNIFTFVGIFARC